MKIPKFNRPKKPAVRYNPELDKLAGQVFFPELVKKANEVLKRVPPPKINGL